MTTTTRTVTGNRRNGPLLQPAPTTRRQAVVRNRGRVAVGIFTLALAGLLAVLVYGNVGQRHPVIAVAKTVDPGQVITLADLRIVRVSTDPDVQTIGASQRSAIVGQRAAIRLLPGSLLTPDAVTRGRVVAAGSSTVGAVVKSGQYPLGLRAGDAVQVVVTGGAAGDRPVDATIVAISSTGGSNGTAISLAVPQEAAVRIAVAGAEGRLLLVVPPG